MSDMFDTQSVVRIFFVLSRLDINSSFLSFGTSSSCRRLGWRILWFLYYWSSPALGLYVSLISRTVMIYFQLSVIFYLLRLIFVCKLALLAFREISPHLAYN